MNGGNTTMKKILAALVALAFVSPVLAEEKAAAPAHEAAAPAKAEKKAEKKDEKKDEKKAKK